MRKRLLLVPMLLWLTGCVTAYRPPADNIYSCGAFENSAKNLIDTERIKSKSSELFDVPLSRSNEEFDYNFDAPPNAIIVRYSEDGRLANRCDYSRVLHAIENGEDQSKIILVYVHGWRNDSGDKNINLYNYRTDGVLPETMGDDLRRFNSFLDDFRAFQKDKPVIGVFISWKGGTGIPVVETLSYTNRRNGADKIGNAGGLPRLLGAIKNISRRQEQESHGILDNQIFLIGHSFGGRILYKAVVDDLIVSTQMSYPSPDDIPMYGDIEGIADLVILLNPAFEAASYQSIDEFRFSDYSFAPSQLPLMMTIQSKSDKANGVYFPIGQFLSFEINSMETRAVGFRKDFQTHELVKLDDRDCAMADEIPQPKDIYESRNIFHNFCYEGVVLRRKPSAEQFDEEVLSPFLMVEANESVLDGHGWYTGKGVDSLNDNDKFEDWLLHYLVRFENTLQLKSDVQISITRAKSPEQKKENIRKQR